MSKPKKSLESFRAAFDPRVVTVNKLRAALDALQKAEGPEAWEEQTAFLRRAGVNQNGIAPFLEDFKAHIVEARSPNRRPVNIWFPDPKKAAIERKNLSG